MTHHHPPLRKKSGKSAIVESYCSGCGVFIAASGSLIALAIAETGHRCPSLASFERGLDVLLRKSPGSVAQPRSVSDARIAPAADGKVDHLLRELSRKEQELDQWIRSSDANAIWFRKDPVAAIRAANLGISEEALAELESVTAVIALKLKAWPQENCGNQVSNSSSQGDPKN